MIRMNNQDIKELANQLKCPSGELGIRVANRMFEANSNMINKTIDRLDLKEKDRVLEFGFGGGKHLSYMFNKIVSLKYVGFEISKLMIDLAERDNKEIIETHEVEFRFYDSIEQLVDYYNLFDHCFAVNTLYFWSDPIKKLQEIFKILKPNGNIALAYIREDFASEQAFALEDVFHFHRTEWLIRVMTNIGYRNVEQWHYMEHVKNKLGKEEVRPFVILKGNK